MCIRDRLISTVRATIEQFVTLFVMFGRRSTAILLTSFIESRSITMQRTPFSRISGMLWFGGVLFWWVDLLIEYQFKLYFLALVVRAIVTGNEPTLPLELLW